NARVTPYTCVYQDTAVGHALAGASAYNADRTNTRPGTRPIGGCSLSGAGILGLQPPLQAAFSDCPNPAQPANRRLKSLRQPRLAAPLFTAQWPDKSMILGRVSDELV